MRISVFWVAQVYKSYFFLQFPLQIENFVIQYFNNYLDIKGMFKMSFDLEEELIKKNISVREILEEYANGQKVSIICKNHKINPDQLRFILRYNENEEINNRRF